MKWYLGVLRNYVNFKGRARRREYWMFFLLNAIFTLVLTAVDSAFHLNKILSTIYSFAVAIPGLAVGARRLHDIGKSGWWQLLGFIPLVGGIILIVFWCQNSTIENKYGRNPKESDWA
ncbi:DUF805 domain-containing protein [Heyndrickxia acidicola]|uniref:DUF805 domain-containing protein n=1 Tax=Heyndrickxia acidicola TaxID=209389 RepID=A0ABU6MGX0_9BACI|nr:DUF805 domain-containing protein [Heyndrickxia acidicola]MED1203921.1 DUF805 domain-containing protein [Heyndrickxia acidicola]